MHRRPQPFLFGIVVAGVLSAAASRVEAFEASITSFSVVKEGNTLFQDTFDDGAPPPSAGSSELATYLYPKGVMSESVALGTLQLAPSTGPVVKSAAANMLGTTFASTSGATFSTNIGSNSSLGLRSANRFSVAGTFALSTNAIAGDGFGIRLTDRNEQGDLGIAPGTGDDVLELRVIRANADTRVQLLRHNFLTDTISAISNQNISAFVANDRTIVLTLQKSTVDGGMSASFSIPQIGFNVSLGTIENNGPIRLFHGEDWTRAEFFAIQTAPIPEPETYALLLTGIGLVGWRLRRSGRKLAAARLA